MDKIKANIVFFLYRAVNFFLSALAFIFWPKKVKNPKKICIYRIGNIGDIVCAIPAIIAIRRGYPDARITLLTSAGQKDLSGAKELLEGAGFIDRLWVYHQDDIAAYHKIYRFFRKLRGESFDLWITLPANLWNLKALIKNMLFVKLCGARQACGFRIDTIRLWTKQQSKFRRFDNEVEHLMRLVKTSGLAVGGEVHYELPITEDIRRSVFTLIKKYQIEKSDLFAFVPGAKYSANQWPVEHFAQAGRLILQRYPQAKIVVFGAADDYDKGKYIEDRIGKEFVVNLCGLTSLLETACLIKRMRLVISNNTGPMHMAALAGVKVIGIFSAAELNGKWFPYGRRAKVAIKRTKCETCYYRRCKYGFMCIKNIKPEEVIGIFDQDL